MLAREVLAGAITVEDRPQTDASARQQLAAWTLKTQRVAHPPIHKCCRAH